MKKLMLIVSIFGMLFVSVGCSKTWSGVKQDSGKVYKDTKQAIHKATA